MPDTSFTLRPLSTSRFLNSLTVLKYRIFCPFSARMLVDGVNLSMLSRAKMGHFFLSSLFFGLSKYIYSPMKI